MRVALAALCLGTVAQYASGQAQSAGGKATVDTGSTAFSESFRNFVRKPADGGGDSAKPGTILSLAVSSDGTWLASAGEDGAIEIRDAKDTTKPPRARLTGHTEPVTCLAISPDGKLLASGSYDRSVRLWDPEKGVEKTAFQGLDGWLLALAFSPDGKTLAAAGRGREVRLWEVATGQESGRIQGLESPIRALAFSPDSKTLATGGDDRVVTLWHLADRTRKATLSGHMGPIRGLGFSGDGTTLVSASEDHTVRLWDLKSQKTISVFPGSIDQIQALAVAPDGRAFAAGAYDGSVRVFEPGVAEPVSTLAAHNEGVTSLAYNPANGTLISTGFDRELKLWTPTPLLGRLRKTLEVGTTPLIQAILSPDGKTLVLHGTDYKLRVWETATWTEKGTITGTAGNIRRVKFSEDSRWLVSSTLEARVVVHDMKTLLPVAHFDFKRESASNGPANRPVSDGATFAIAPDGGSIAALSTEGEILIYSLPRATPEPPATPTELKPKRTLYNPKTEKVQDLAFTPDGESLAIALGSEDLSKCRIALVDLEGGKEKGSFATAQPRLTRMVFAPDGESLALVTRPKLILPRQRQAQNDQKSEVATLELFSLEGNKQQARLDLPPGSLDSSLDFVASSGRVAVGLASGSVQFWDVLDLKPAGLLRAADGPLTRLAFGPDGRTLVTVARKAMTGAPAVGAVYASPGSAPALSNEPVVKVWELFNDSGRPLTWRAPPVLDARYSPDGKTLALACDDGSITLLDPGTYRVKKRLTGHSFRVWSLAFSPDGRTLVSGSGDWNNHDETGELRVWDPATGKEVAKPITRLPLVFSVAVSPDGKTLASGGWTNEVRLWDLASGKEIARLEGHTGSVRRVVFAPDGKTLASSSFDRTVRLWDVSSATGASVKLVLKAHGTGVNGLAFSPDGKTLATGAMGAEVGQSGGSGELALWDVATGRELRRSGGRLKGQILSLAFSPDGKSIASSGGDFANFAELWLWDADTLRPRQELSGHTIWVEGVTFSSDGQTLISCGGVSGRPGEVRAWDLDLLKNSRRNDGPPAGQ